MNGDPLPLEHGFPVRMVVPGLYGYVSATKWVVDLNVTTFAEETAYWTDRGWAPQAPIKTASRIDVPAGFAQLSKGSTVAVAGVAWAQHRGISGVQVQIDDGDWQDATLSGEVSADTWRQWVYQWDATESGTHTLRCRAIDGTGDGADRPGAGGDAGRRDGMGFPSGDGDRLATHPTVTGEHSPVASRSTTPHGSALRPCSASAAAHSTPAPRRTCHFRSRNVDQTRPHPGRRGGRGRHAGRLRIERHDRDQQLLRGLVGGRRASTASLRPCPRRHDVSGDVRGCHVVGCHAVRIGDVRRDGRPGRPGRPGVCRLRRGGTVRRRLGRGHGRSIRWPSPRPTTRC